MADTKISDMTDLTALATGDEVPVADASDLTANKSFTLGSLITFLQQANGLPRIKRLTADHSNSTTTGTEVTDLSITLEAGTYVFDYRLICQSDGTTTGVGLGINFTGTATRQAFWTIYPDAGGLSTGTGVIDDVVVNPGNMRSGTAARTFTTTAPNLISSGVSVVTVDLHVLVHGIIVVSVAGDLELWHSSETAVATRIEQDSSLVVIWTA